MTQEIRPPLVTLRSPTPSGGGAIASIAPLGAELQRWTVDGHDLLWSGDPQYWAQRSPILFPIVGWARDGVIRVAGNTYPMGVHGFASEKTFVVTELTDHAATFVLRDDEDTRARYPFAFTLTLRYALASRALSLEATVHNPSTSSALPYAFGVHPGFRIPLAGGDPHAHRIVFEHDERPEVPVIAPGGLFSTRTRPVPFVERALSITPELLANEALCFLDAKSRSVRLENGMGTALETRADSFGHFALWSKRGAPFVCIEAWTGHGDPEGFAGNLFEKPSMCVLAPGRTASHRVEWVFRRAADSE